jgi:tRNA threonylcarbamoyl adenosine modification protein YjeE
VVALEGDLGAGKTELARAVIWALAGEAVAVPSPTFTLLQVYDLPSLTVTHADLYRLADADEVAELGLEEAWADGVLLVEWPERAGGLLPAERLTLTLRHVVGEAEAREVEVVGPERFARLVP